MATIPPVSQPPTGYLPRSSNAAAPSASSSSPSDAAAANSLGSLGSNAFLKLLVAQLKYQDPTNPTSSSEMMNQTAQFTMVEKLDEIAKQNTDLIASQRISASAALVGRTVNWLNTDGTNQTGVVQAVRFASDGSTQIKVMPNGASAAIEVPYQMIQQIEQTPPASSSSSIPASVLASSAA